MDDYKAVVTSSGLQDTKFTLKTSSACVSPDTRDPLGKAVLNGLKERTCMENDVASLYVEGCKA